MSTESVPLNQRPIVPAGQDVPSQEAPLQTPPELLPKEPQTDEEWEAHIAAEEKRLSEQLAQQQAIKQAPAPMQQQEQVAPVAPQTPSIEPRGMSQAPIIDEKTWVKDVTIQPVVEQPTAPVQQAPVVEPPKIEQPTQPVPEVKAEADAEAADKTVALKPNLEMSDEEFKRTHDIALANNANSRLYTTIGSRAELNDLLEIISNEDVRSDDAKEQTPNMELLRYYSVGEYGMTNYNQHHFTRDTYLHVNGNFTPVRPDARMSKVKASAITRRANNGYLTGHEAKLAVLVKTQGLYRVNLYNSGFWAICRPPTIGDMAGFVNEVDVDMKEIGRIFGGHLHLVMDNYLKTKVLEIFSRSIVDSNLVGWSDPTTLGAAISFHDYETIVWSFCCMLYRDGVGMGVHCTNPECRYEDRSQHIDLTKAVFINPAVFTSAAYEFLMHPNATRTLQEVERYRDSLLGNGVGNRVFNDEGTDFTYRFKVPSLATYIEMSANTVSRMHNIVYTREAAEDVELRTKLIYHVYQMFAPWIAQMDMKDDNGNYIKITDPSAFETALEIQVQRKGKLYGAIDGFVKDTRATLFALTTLECPQCHKRPDLNGENIHPLVLDYVFFALCCLSMEQSQQS